MDRERHLIEMVRRSLPVAESGIRVGIGDDAAVLRTNKREWVVTTDAFVEGVHFLLKAHPADSVGYKCLARSTSDIAAMGARPRYFLLNLALPASLSASWFREFLNGMRRACRDCHLVLIGGDTTRQASIAVNITVIGDAEAGRTVQRSGARPGDLVCISGRLGEAALGLQLVLHGLHRQKQWRSLLTRHLHPEPRIALSQRLAGISSLRGNSLHATSMIDVSDGLSTDLTHLCEASGVGANVVGSQIPKVRIPDALQKFASRWPRFDPLTLALHGGDDYELLFTINPNTLRFLPRSFLGVPLTVIGEITKRKRVVLIDETGRETKLPAQGWEPFRDLQKRAKE